MALRGRAGRDERGGVAVIVAVSALAMFAFAALVVDLGHARDVRRQSQNASDAAALAAGNALFATSALPNIPKAVAAAKSYARDNFGVPLTAWDGCTDSQHYVVPSGSTQCVSFSPDLTNPTEVRVRMPDVAVQTPFASLLGITAVDIASLAHAAVDPGRRADCGLCVLGPQTHDLENGDITVTNAAVHFNGNVYPKPNGSVSVTAGGGITVEKSAMAGDYSPTPVTGVPPIPDPLTLVTMPSAAGLQPRTNPCNDGPGIYGARTISNVTCTLRPGLYVIAGTGTTKWLVEGSSSSKLRGDGVTLYFTCGTSTVPRPCAAGEAGALLDAGGEGSVEIKAPLSPAPWAGMAIIYDRNNTSELRLRGNGLGQTTGTIYLAKGTLYIAGNGCATPIDSLIVVDHIDMDGNLSCLTAQYTTEKNILLPGGALHLSR